MASASGATITNNLNASLGFNGNSTAGSANIANNQSVTFSNSSTAGSATITNNSNGAPNTTVLNFTGMSDAGNANITNNASGFSNGSTGVIFQSSASANSATITNASGAGLFFLNTSTAGSAKITNNATTSVVSGAFLNGTVFENTSTAGTAKITNNGDLIFEGGSKGGSATITNNSGGTLSFLNTSTAGSANITNNNITSFGTNGGTDTSTAGGATITNNGTLSFNAGTKGGSATINNNALGTLNFFNTSTAGTASITNNSTVLVDPFTFHDSSTAGSATITNNQILSFQDTSSASSATITNNSGGTTFLVGGGKGGTARFIMNGTGALDISQFTVGVAITAGSIEGNGNVFLGDHVLTVGGNNSSTTFSGVIQDGGACGGTVGSLVKEGTGTLILSGTNIYTGATMVTAGTLEVDGSITTSNLATVSGATLSGIGALTTTQVNSGILARGNAANPTGALGVKGSLTFQSAALYMIGINGSAAGSTSVAGTATLGDATVQVASGSTVTPGVKYTILTTIKGGTVSGTFNPAVTFGTLKGTLSYDATDVFLTFAFPTLTPLLPPNAPTNVVNTANGIDNFVNGGGTLPAAFQNLTNLSPSQLANALTHLDGEAATDAEKGAFTLMTEFLGLLLDPSVDGRTGGLGTGASNFAPEQEASFPPDVALAYAALVKAPPKPKFEQRWTVWGAGFGGSNTTNGNATIGSNNVTASDFGFAVGADYHYSPDTLLGFALAGAGTNWGLAQNLGGGRSDAFMVGGYGITHFGPAYLAADAAFANHWFSTSRTEVISSQRASTAKLRRAS
jgi:uncharacterized protein with beta-barrel porin domain